MPPAGHNAMAGLEIRLLFPLLVKQETLLAQEFLEVMFSNGERSLPRLLSDHKFRAPPVQDSAGSL